MESAITMPTPPPEVLKWAEQFQKPDPNAMMNLESQGYKNLWFSRAGQYDRAHKGTFGNQQTRELLSQLDQAPLGFKPQISAGYANTGHSNGKGGEHVRGGVFDIGLSGRTTAEAGKLKNILAAKGVDFLEEGAGTGNWHLHVRGKNGKKGQPQARAPQSVNPAPREIQPLGVPAIPAGAKVVPLGLGLPSVPARADIQASLAAREQALAPPVPQPQVPIIQPGGSRPTRTATPPPEVQAWAQQFHKPAATGFQGLWNAAGDFAKTLPDQIGNAGLKEVQSQQANPLFNQQEAMIAGLGGALSSPTDLINLVTQAPAAIGNAWQGREAYKPLLPVIPGVRDIPGVKDIMERHPVFDFVGGAVVPVEGAIGAAAKLGKGGKAAKAVAKELPAATKALPPGPEFITRQQQAIEAARAAEPNAATLRPEMANAPSNTRELSESFATRQRPAGNPEIITPQQPAAQPLLLPGRQPAEAPRLEISRGIPEGRAAEPNTLNPITGQPYELPGSAKESAQAIAAQMDDAKVAEQLRNEAINTLRMQEQKLQALGQSDSLVDAQRNVGAQILELEAKAQTGQLTAAEGQTLTALRQSLDETLAARKQLQDADRLLSETLTPQARASVTAADTPRVQELPTRELPTTRDIAMRRAEETAGKSDDAPITKPAGVRGTSPVEPPAPREVGQPSSILERPGQPAAAAARELELPNQPRPTNPADLEIPRSFERPAAKEAGQPISATLDAGAPKVREIGTAPSAPKAPGNVHTRPSGGEVYTQGRTPESVEALAAALEKNNQILALEDAKRLLDTKRKAGMLSPEDFRKQTDVLNLFEEAGRTGKSFSALRREIKEGMGTISKELGKQEIKNREGLAPFAVTVRQRKPATEVSNLLKELGSAEAVQSKMRQLAGQYGITPTTASSGRAKNPVLNNATRIAQQIADHPQGKLHFQDIYLNAHNFKTGGIKTATDAPRGYPLRTIESANVGTEVSRIPEGALNTNQIKAQYEALEALKASPDIAPEIKQLVTKVTDNPNVNFKDIRKMRESISKNLQSFCDIWRLK